MTTFARSLRVSLGIVLVSTDLAAAGMPSVTLADLPNAVRAVSRTGITDLARQRIEVLSFFLTGLLGCAWVIRWVWNGLRVDFPILPRLSYPRALGIIVLWGLLFVLVLTMISGARELMTPGAWVKKGLTYQLANNPPPPIEAEIAARNEALVRLRDQLFRYAGSHDGEFPTLEQAGAIPDSLWHVPPPVSGRYVYRGGHRSPLAYEPESAGSDRLVLMANGNIQWLPATELERMLSTKEP